MSQTPLKYCCPNPDCHNKFLPEDAKRSFGLIEIAAKDSGKGIPWEFSLVHLLCPDCNTIVTSVHVPFDPM
jgi:hypothetical protein